MVPPDLSPSLSIILVQDLITELGLANISYLQLMSIQGYGAKALGGVGIRRVNASVEIKPRA